MRENMFSPGQKTLTEEGRENFDRIFRGKNSCFYCGKEKKGVKELRGKPVCKYCFGVRHRLYGEI